MTKSNILNEKQKSTILKEEMKERSREQTRQGYIFSTITYTYLLFLKSKSTRKKKKKQAFATRDQKEIKNGETK